MAAFYGEISSLLYIIYKRDFMDTLDVPLEMMKYKKYFPPQGNLLNISFDDYFAVYRSNLQSIGMYRW